MSRLIDADELIEHVWREDLDTREKIANLVERMPTASDWDRYSTKLWKEAYERGKRDGQSSAQPNLQPTCNQLATDCISRQAAIDYVDDVPYIKDHPNIALLWKAWVEQLPAAQPERMRGRWMEHYSHEDGERDGVECSECRTHFYFGGQLMNYCPNCGADMREGDT